LALTAVLLPLIMQVESLYKWISAPHNKRHAACQESPGASRDDSICRTIKAQNTH
jgi:hypothetical protein